MLEFVLAFFFGVALGSAKSAPLYDGPLDAYLPCAPGLSVRYRLSGGGEMVETVRGKGGEPRSCVIDRVVRSASGKVEKSAWMREHLPDRIANAGWVELPQAFRPPILKLPLEKGRKWHFNRVNFEIAAILERFEVPAGVFEDVVVVSEEATEGGKYHEVHAYARGVGLIRSVRDGGDAMEAIEVRR